MKMANAQNGLAQALASLGRELKERTVTVGAPGGASGASGASGGAGVIWSPDGLIVTNAHVARAESARVELADGRALRARRVAIDEARDVAALRVAASDLPSVRAGDAAGLRPGALVVALGNPLGWTGALALGVVHHLDRLGHAGPGRLKRADIRLAPGNSGGPLADAGGNVVGINTMVAGGLGLALPVSTVERFLAPPEHKATLGVVLRPVAVRVPTGLAACYLVLETAVRGAAQRAGVLPGDVLVGLGGHAFSQPGDLERALDAARPGQVVTLELLRGRTRLERTVMLLPDPVAAKVA